MKPLNRQEPELVLSMLAAVSMNAVPLDLVVTDGATYTLYHFQGLELLKYEDLSAKQVSESWC